MTLRAVEATLRAVAEPFAAGAAPEGAGLELRWGPLFAALGGLDDDGYVEAIELIYEGYLLHYRRDRLGLVVEGDREKALLAGDVFYARGLEVIAGRGDVESVALLTRLMSACSCLRSLAAPFAADDALWAYTVAGLAGLRAGIPAARVGELFDRLDAELKAGAPAGVPARAAAAAAALGLPDPAPLEMAFAALLPSSAAAAPSTPASAVR